MSLPKNREDEKMKITYKKGQAATEFLMTYGWAILAIVIVAAVLWNMGIFKGSCTSTSPVQVFPSGSQLAVADWTVDTNNNINMSVSNLAGNDVVVGAGYFYMGSAAPGTTLAGAPVTITAGNKGVIYISGNPAAAGTAGNCFSNAKVTLSYNLVGGVSGHNVTGTLQGKY